jgi:hypothetical protein
MNALNDGRVLLERVVGTPRRHAFFVVLFYSLLFLTLFSPIVFGGKLLAIGGDGLNVYLPNFYSHKTFWDPMIFSGFPMMADPEVRTWYPPAFLLSLLPGSWNVFTIFAFTAAGSFLYGYVYTITESRRAALVGGIVFGLSGFMMAQLGNSVIIHSTAWVPLIIWSLEQLCRKLSLGWLVIGSFAVTLCLLGGQPQIFVYALIMAGVYALARGWTSVVGRSRYYVVVLSMIALGVSLAVIQIIPARELVGQSMRANFSFQDFVSYSLPPRQSLTLIFPYVFGGLREAGFISYFGRDNQTELTGYVGLLPLMLGGIALFVSKQKFFCFFWLSVALLSFVLVLGDATPLARAVYHLPILSSFRIPARHFMEFTFAISVLSGLGTAAIIKRGAAAGFAMRVILISAITMLSALVLLALNTNRLMALAGASCIHGLSLLPWMNRAVSIPLIVFVVGLAALLFWHSRPASILRSTLLLLVLVIDLGSFGYFYQWRYFSIEKNTLTAPSSAEQLKNSLRATNQRLMSYRCYRGTEAEMPAALTRLWGIPNACGYDALILRRVSELLPMIDQPESPLPWTEPQNRGLDLMAVRYLVLPHPETSMDEHGTSWLKDSMQFWLGSGCGKPTAQRLTMTLPAPTQSTSIAIVSRMACSTQIPNGADVARVSVVDAKENVQTQSLAAGHDTSEWAYDCASVKSQMQHQRATIFSSFPAMMNDEPCEGHSYITTLSFNQTKEIKRIEFDWNGGAGALILDKLTLIDDSTRTSHPVDPSLLASNDWRQQEPTSGARTYENLRAMPRVWLTSEAVSLNPEQILDTIKSGKLPDGRSFDPRRTALVEGAQGLNLQVSDSKASATVATLSNTQMEVHTLSATPAFLITSDAYYPGWRASIDGKETPVYRADYAIRGVLVPEGEHSIRFNYRPRNFYLGVTISALSLLALSGIALRALFALKSRKASRLLSL